MSQVIVRGVVEVPTELLSGEDVEHIKQTLTFESEFQGKSTVEGFRSTDSGYLLPKFYFVKFLLSRLKKYIVNREPKCVEHKWKFHGQLRQHQLNPRPGHTSTPRLAELVRLKKGIFASAPCGSGKTVTAIYVIAMLGLRTLIVTPNETVRKQWIQQVRRFLPGVRVTEYSGKKKDLSGDVVVASLQLLSMYPIAEEFPFYVLDEAHMAATAEFQKAMFHVNFKYSLALTATGDRLDGLGALFQWPLSFMEVKLDTDQMPITVVYRPVQHTEGMKDVMENVESMLIDNELVMIVHRNTQLMGWIDNAYRNGRRIMVISKSIIQLRLLHHVFSELRPEAKTAMFTGEVTVNGKAVKELKRTKAQKASDECYLNDPDAVVFSTVGKAGVGYDDPSKDCLILAMPMQDPRQVIGRVQRRLPDKKPPVALIPVDDLMPIRRRMLSAYNKTLAPLEDRCFLHNECSFYVHDLPRGRYVRHKVQSKHAKLYRASQA